MAHARNDNEFSAGNARSRVFRRSDGKQRIPVAVKDQRGAMDGFQERVARRGGDDGRPLPRDSAGS